MSQQTIDVSDLPVPFVEAIEAAIRAYRERAAQRPTTPRKAGWAAKILPELPDSFFDPLPNDLLDLFEGKSA